MTAPSTQDLLSHWTWSPTIIIGLVMVAVGYWYATGPLCRARNWGNTPTGSQLTYFVAAHTLLVVALISPLDTVSDTYLFSGHMVQHLLLATLWPPLLLLSLPDWVGRKALQGAHGAVLSFFSYPAVALLAFNLDIYGWHIPGAYNMTLQNEYVHILEHLTFMMFGVFNWWPVLSPAREQRLSAPLQVLYLIADGMFMMVLGIVFTFAPTVFYSAYESAPRLWGVSASTDQQIGGLIMWYPGNLPYAWLLVVAFYKWFDAGGPESAESHWIESQSPTIGPPAP